MPNYKNSVALEKLRLIKEDLEISEKLELENIMEWKDEAVKREAVIWSKAVKADKEKLKKREEKLKNAQLRLKESKNAISRKKNQLAVAFWNKAVITSRQNIKYGEIMLKQGDKLLKAKTEEEAQKVYKETKELIDGFSFFKEK